MATSFLDTATSSIATAITRPAGNSAPIASGTIHSTSDLAALASGWDAIDQPGPSPMQSFAWSLACYRTAGWPAEPCVLCEAQDGRLEGVAPLVVDRHTRPARLRMPGVRKLHEPMDLIAHDPAVLERLAQRIVGLGQPTILDRVPADSPTLAALRRACTGRAWCVVRPQASFPFIALSSAWNDPESQLSSRRRSDLRRARKRAESHGPLACDILTPSAEDLDALLDEAFEIEARSWKGTEGTALQCDPGRADFYKRYALAACQQGTLRICRLRLGSTTVAMQIAIEAYGRFWLLKIGYDDEFARVSPGNLLICETLRYATGQGLESYEFLGSSEAWTRVWTETERASVSVRIYPHNPRGLAALAADVARSAWRKLLRRCLCWG